MNLTFGRGKITLLALAALATVAACVVAPGGYDGTVGVGYVGGYYAPGGYDYGGWGRGYQVGPPRGGPPVGHGGRSAPSIPSRPHER